MTPLNTLADYLSGEFENAAQAAESATWFVHLRLWQRRIPALSSETTHTFFLEQSSVGANKPPYRQRILQITEQITEQTTEKNDAALRGQYFALSNPSQFIGAGADERKLEAMSAADLVELPNSESHISYEVIGADSGRDRYRFKSALPDGKLCSFNYAGQARYVYLGFDIEQTSAQTIELLTYDKGIDPDTGRGLWGALMGPFQMVKQA